MIEVSKRIDVGKTDPAGQDAAIFESEPVAKTCAQQRCSQFQIGVHDIFRVEGVFNAQAKIDSEQFNVTGQLNRARDVGSNR